MSALAFYFARVLREKLDVPIGIVDVTMGGTRIEPWMRRELFTQSPALGHYLKEFEKLSDSYDVEAETKTYERALKDWRKAVTLAEKKNTKLPDKPGMKRPPKERWQYPSTFYNGMISPLKGFGIRGFLWYQGESNTGRAPSKPDHYKKSLQLLINDWRQQWGMGELPFYFVQIAAFGITPRWDGKSVVRNQMREAMKIENTGMAVTYDIGSVDNVHPLNKIEAGGRLALWPLLEVYQKGNIKTARGPIPVKAVLNNETISIEFEATAKGLLVGSKTPLKEPVSAGIQVPMIEVQDEDGVWKEVSATLKNSKTVELDAKSIRLPQEIRYGWHSTPTGNVFLYNSEGLPASPFRIKVN
ncbi:MAG: sialate O-acetylesterase [Verrucomicrobiota bacterium]